MYMCMNIYIIVVYLKYKFRCPITWFYFIWQPYPLRTVLISTYICWSKPSHMVNLSGRKTEKYNFYSG